MNDLGKNHRPFIFVIDFLMNKSLIVQPEEAEKSGILYWINGKTNNIETLPGTPSFEFRKYPLPFEDFAVKFRHVMRHIKEGNTYLLNLTGTSSLETDITLKQIFLGSRAPYKLLYKDDFVVFSPECFIRISGNTITTYPMKGTINAEVENAGNVILSDPKETAEHYTIVDLLRNDLNRVARHVKVDVFRYIDRVDTHTGSLFQVSSKISGELDENWNEFLGDLFFSLLPAGSVTGAPKEKTIEIILETEGYERGYYTGVFGIFDGKDLDSGVMIRFIENTPAGKIFKSGGGITSFSEMEKEYRELIDKVYVPLV